jgi:hypothetical protein
VFDLERMFTMTDQSTEATNQRVDVSYSADRRRVTDLPQPLDYVTRELVSGFIEEQQRATPSQQSLIQKLLRVDSGSF